MITSLFAYLNEINSVNRPFNFKYFNRFTLIYLPINDSLRMYVVCLDSYKMNRQWIV